MCRTDQEVAAGGNVFLTIGLEPEPEYDEDDEAGDEADQTIQDGGGRLRRPAEPGEPFDRSAPGGGERLRRDAGRRPPAATRRRRTVGLVHLR
jgi:hypothetical protein